MKRKVVVPGHCGACPGVNGAFIKAKQCLSGGNVVVSRHDLVHNPRVLAIDPFNRIGIFTGEKASAPNSYYLVVPHGEEPIAIDNARTLGYEICDLTCPHVAKSQKLVRDAVQLGRSVIICGECKIKDGKKVYHQETVGLMAQGDSRLVKVAATLEEADKIAVDDKCLVLRQSTLPDELFDAMRVAIKHTYPEAEVVDTGCSAVSRIINSAIGLLKINSGITVAIVMGGVESSNTRNLADAIIAAREGIEVFRAALPWELINGCGIERHKSILLTGGASCPQWVIKETQRMIENL